MFMFTLGPSGGAAERRRFCQCQPFVPVVRKQAETAPLHFTVPLQLKCLTKLCDPRPQHCFVLFQSDLIRRSC